jgi:Tol biopolymer transport system component
MRLVLIWTAAIALLAGCGKNQITVEIVGGDGQLVRLDANDVQYKFNKLVQAGIYVFPSPDSDAELRSGSYTVNVVAGNYLETKVLQLESPPISGAQDYKVTFQVPAGSNTDAAAMGTILYASTPQSVRKWDLFTVEADGSGRRQLTDTPEAERHPSWSPDGQKILFTSGNGMTNIDLFVMDADGANVQRLTEHPERDRRAVWSPDGQTIAFVSQRDGNVSIWLMDTSGANKRKLVEGREPTWSPDGQKIAFTSSAFDDNDEIYIVDLDGSNRLRLTENKKFDWFAAWSPNGRSLAYNSEQFGGEELMLINIDGSARTRISLAEKTYEQEPSWSSDGKHLAYAGKMEEEDYDIYLVATRGFDYDDLAEPVGMPINLTNNDDRDDMSPRWRPF